MPAPHHPQLLDRQPWDALREALATGNAPDDVRSTIDSQAAAALNEPIRTLMDRPDGPMRPTDDPHAYASIGTYFHPNPDTPDGLPWVGQDGKFSPAFSQYDRPLWDRLADTVKTLGQAAFLLDRQDLAARLTDHLRGWMVDPATRMRPDVLHSQFIPGKHEGSWVGIIDFSTRMPALLDAASLVWPHVPDGVQAGVSQWCSEFLDWLVDGPYSADIFDPGRNNHGTFGDRLMIYLALWLGRNDIAAERLGRFVPDRLMTQVCEDGTQPHEMGRTLSWNYTVMNTIGLLHLAGLAEDVGPSPLDAGESGHERLHAAVAFLVPYLIGEKEWTWQQIKPIDAVRAWPVVVTAERRLGFDGLIDRWCEHVGIASTPWMEALLAFELDAHPLRK